MPLKAYRGTEPLVGPLLSDPEWQQLRRDAKAGLATLRMPCCGGICYPRVSKLGTWHFAHKRVNGCTTAPETLEHLLVKAEAVLGCRDAGYEAESEFAEDDWRADVLAVRGDTRLAFEVQWSAQTLEETKARQERYHRAGIEGVWLFRRLPHGSTLRADLPVFQLDLRDRDRPLVGLGIRETTGRGYGIRSASMMSVRTFVSAFLTRQIKLCEKVYALDPQSVRIAIVENKCWCCSKDCHMYIVDPDANNGLITPHGWGCAYLFEGFKNAPIDHPVVVNAIAALLKTDAGRGLRMGVYKKRYSRTAREAYLSQGCPHCDALFGDWFLTSEPERCEYPRVASLDLEVPLDAPYIVDWPHWCYSERREFCC